LALGGGAPNLTLMTGALLALDEAGVEPKVITTTGAGMVAGLLYAAPRKEHPDEDWVTARRRALRQSREMGIDDFIYDQLPMNFKIFQKGGTMAEAWAQVFGPAIWSIPRETRRQRLLGDTLGLMSAIMQPGYMALESKGICQPPPWIDLIVDFDDLEGNLSAAQIDFLLTAFCIEDKKERNFRNSEITAEQFKAALAMPFLYSPYKLAEPDGTVKTYLEASAFRTMEFNPEGVMTDRGIEAVVYFDLMGNEHLIGEPKNIIDAWGKSIVAPLTQLARQQVEVDLARRWAVNNTKLMGEELFVLQAHVEKLVKFIHEMEKAVARVERKGKGIEECQPLIDDLKKTFNKHMLSEEAHEEIAIRFAEQEIHRKILWLIQGITQGSEDDQVLTHTLLRMPFRDNIPEDHWPFVLDWSHSNMSKLFDIGYETAQRFVDDHWDQLGLEQGAHPDIPEERDAQVEGDIVWGFTDNIRH
jgi:predicted acylesterase/phospholipase RssA